MIQNGQTNRWDAGSYVNQSLYANGVSYQTYYSAHGKAMYKGKDGDA